jgi:hypothetical protein
MGCLNLQAAHFFYQRYKKMAIFEAANAKIKALNRNRSLYIIHYQTYKQIRYKFFYQSKPHF